MIDVLYFSFKINYDSPSSLEFYDTNCTGRSFTEERNVIVVCEPGLHLDPALGTNSRL